MRVRKKPVEVNAWEVVEGTAQEIANKCGGRVWYIGKSGQLYSEPFPTVHEGNKDGMERCKVHEIRIRTLEGTMTASLGDYVIEGVEGEYYPCKPDIFWKTYEVVE